MMRPSTCRERRGQAEMLTWIPRLFLMAVALFLIVFLVRFYSDRDVDAAQVERASVIYALYYSDLIMASDDLTKRVEPGVVDLDKINDKILEDAKFPKNIGVKVTIVHNGGSTEAYANKQLFQTYEGFAKGTTRGDISGETRIWPVAIDQDGKRVHGQLTIAVVRR
jgi:hypothetical protein